MRADDTTFVASSKTTTDMRKFDSRAKAMAPSMMTRASSSEICDGVNGAGGGFGVCATLMLANVSSSDRLPITTACEDETQVFIVSSRWLSALAVRPA